MQANLSSVKEQRCQRYSAFNDSAHTLNWNAPKRKWNKQTYKQNLTTPTKYCIRPNTNSKCYRLKDELIEIRGVPMKRSDNHWRPFCLDSISVPSALKVYKTMHCISSHFCIMLQRKYHRNFTYVHKVQTASARKTGACLQECKLLRIMQKL